VNGGGFAGAIWPQEPQDFTFVDAKGNIINGRKIAKSLCQISNFNNGLRHRNGGPF
jgi:hypothetical protein